MKNFFAQIVCQQINSIKIFIKSFYKNIDNISYIYIYFILFFIPVG